MSFLVNIVTADEEEVEAVGLSQHPVSEWSGLEARDLGTSELATLHCLLCGDSFEEALSAYEPAWAGGDEGALVLRIPDEVAEKLASLEEDALENVADELAATEEFERHGWPFDEVLTLMQQMAELAQLADAQGQVMLAWLHPLRT